MRAVRCRHKNRSSEFASRNIFKPQQQIIPARTYIRHIEFFSNSPGNFMYVMFSRYVTGATFISFFSGVKRKLTGQPGRNRNDNQSGKNKDATARNCR